MNDQKILHLKNRKQIITQEMIQCSSLSFDPHYQVIYKIKDSTIFG